MMQYSPNKIEEYTFLDFSEEFGYLPDERADETVVSEPQNVVFAIKRVEAEIPKEPYAAPSGGGIPDLNSDRTDELEYGADSGGIEVNKADEEEFESDTAAMMSSEEAENILSDAHAEAERIINEAMEAAESIRERAAAEAETAIKEAEETAYDEGFKKGQSEGFESAHDEAKKELDEKNRSLLEEIKRAIAELEKLKSDYMRQYNDSMKELVIAIAEKVIKVSLKSSGEVITRMILAAVENSSKKEWAKIYISEYDANLMVREDSDILDALRKVSDHIKVIKMENGESGDLIVEFPDQAIDASVSTQLENIRHMMSDESIMRQSRL
jgi:flagellar assembly protein FliH